jgi:hypothetical protein
VPRLPVFYKEHKAQAKSPQPSHRASLPPTYCGLRRGKTLIVSHQNFARFADTLEKLAATQNHKSEFKICTNQQLCTKIAKSLCNAARKYVP